VAYEDVFGITVGGREYVSGTSALPAKPLELHHARGVMTLPPVMNVPVADFHDFLRSQLPPAAEQSVPQVLGSYLAEQRGKFGHDKVQVIHTRRILPAVWRRRWQRWIGGALFVTGMAWMAAGIYGVSHHRGADDFGIWIALGIAVILISVPFFLVDTTERADRILMKHPNACMIVGPAGIALTQGVTQGALRWNEILGVTSKLRKGRTGGVHIRVQGAEIIVLDIYERAPREIEEMLRRNLDSGAA
jgi:hypothetical protein